MTSGTLTARPGSARHDLSVLLVDARGLLATRPDRDLFRDVSVTVGSGDRLGVVGINGCGKSTLLRVLAGHARPEAGEVRHGRGVRIGVLDQDPVLPDVDVRAAAGGTWQAEAVLDRLGMGGMFDARCTTLSGGQAKRVALARLLVDEHDLLILDEPTNHLDLDAVSFLEDRLAAHRGGLVLVTHDRHVLDRLTTEVLELDRGHGYRHVPAGEHAGSGYAAYLAGRAERAERSAEAEQTRRNLARAELAWLRRGAPARTRKPKARIEAAEALVQGRPASAARPGDLALELGTTRLGSKVVELHGVTFAYAGAPPVLESVDLVIEPGDRLGVVGPNGVGKSTLLGLVAGRLAPASGRVEVGTTVVVGELDQRGARLDPAMRVRNAVVGPHREPDWADARLMERFWFDADAQWAPIGTLSGGERRRLQLLMVLAAKPNLLLLDEPTNDLDLDTLRALEDFLEDWPGALVTVSHDRSFLDRVTTEVLALDGRGGATSIRGGYAGWMAWRSASAPARETAPPAGRAPERAAKAPSPMRSPSTLRRLVGQAERDVAAATSRRDALAGELAGVVDHRSIAALGEQLAQAQAVLDAAEEAWLALAAEAETAGVVL
jgi:ATP-binding cassette subfamily F protein uup